MFCPFKRRLFNIKKRATVARFNPELGRIGIKDAVHFALPVTSSSIASIGRNLLWRKLSCFPLPPLQGEKGRIGYFPSYHAVVSPSVAFPLSVSHYNAGGKPASEVRGKLTFRRDSLLFTVSCPVCCWSVPHCIDQAVSCYNHLSHLPLLFLPARMTVVVAVACQTGQSLLCSGVSRTRAFRCLSLHGGNPSDR